MKNVYTMKKNTVILAEKILRSWIMRPGTSSRYNFLNESSVNRGYHDKNVSSTGVKSCD